MNHPFVGDLQDLSISEIESKIAELSRKYFMTHNPDMQMQLSMIIDIYKEEAKARRAKENQIVKNQDNDDNSLDNLINIS